MIKDVFRTLSLSFEHGNSLKIHEIENTITICEILSFGVFELKKY